MQDRVSIFEVDAKKLAEWFVEKGGKPYWAHQTFRWVFEKMVFDPSRYSDMPEKFRNSLLEDFSFELPRILESLESKDGSIKVVIELTSSHLVECVVMPAEGRITLCLSSQVGCKMGCAFCHTGTLGFTRNLGVAEIISQLLLAYQIIKAKNITGRITNLVFMGMGEPLDNYNNVVAASKIFLHKDFFGISKHKLTISTCGMIPEINKLGMELPLRLAISLHSADQEQRSELMPIAKRYPLAELKKALLAYPSGRDGITFEYILIKEVNDSLVHAKKLVQFLNGINAKVNIIPVNYSPNSNFSTPSAQKIEEFQQYLSSRGIVAPVRYSRGQDILGACGQLVASIKPKS